MGAALSIKRRWLWTTVAKQRHCGGIVPSCLSVLDRTEMWLQDPVTAWNMGVSSLKSLYHTTTVCLSCVILSHNGLLSFIASLCKIASSFKIKVSLPSTLNLKIDMKRLPCCLPTLPLPHVLELSLSPPKEPLCWTTTRWNLENKYRKYVQI